MQFSFRLIGELVIAYQYHGDVGESVVSLTNIAEARVVQENFLQNEGSYRFAELRPTFHDPQTERNYLSGQQKGDHFLLIRFDQGSNHTQRGQP